MRRKIFHFGHETLNNLTRLMLTPRVTALATGITLIGAVAPFFTPVQDVNVFGGVIEAVNTLRDSVDQNTQVLIEHTKAINDQTEAVNKNLELQRSNQAKSWFQRMLENIQIEFTFERGADNAENNVGNTLGEDRNVEGIPNDNRLRRVRR